MALTSSALKSYQASSWSYMVDQLAYNDGAKGRLIIISAGNTDPSNYQQICKSFPHFNLALKIQDPSQALNSLTVGAVTFKTLLPPGDEYSSYEMVAPHGQISPHSSSGFTGRAIKPEIVLEGGNMAFDGVLPVHNEATFMMTSLKNTFVNDYFTGACGTSASTGLASQISAKIWNKYPNLRAETVKALIVHSASWTEKMWETFEKREERLMVCGYGVPDLDFAINSMSDKATIVIEDTIKNGELYREKGVKKVRRFVKFFKLPVPESELFNLNENYEVELRVTLSYFIEPNHYRRKSYNGLDLRWDIQGPQESENEFKTRINKIRRDNGEEFRQNGMFQDWEIGPQARSRGTVQADRWTGSASYLAGDKFIAVMPTLGWWDRRRDFKEKELNFSLVISVKFPDTEIYETIKTSIESEVEISESVDLLV